MKNIFKLISIFLIVLLVTGCRKQPIDDIKEDEETPIFKYLGMDFSFNNDFNNEIDLELKSNQSFYVRLRLDNENEIEITSVVINNISFNKDIFLADSDFNNIILLVSCFGEEYGEVEFKLTEINYQLDSFTSKSLVLDDVKKINVIPNKNIYVSSYNIDVKSTTAKMDIEIFNYLNQNNDKYKLEIEDENGAIANGIKDLSCGKNEINLSNLNPSKLYKFFVYYVNGNNEEDLIYFNHFTTLADFELINIYNSEKNNEMIVKTTNDLIVEFHNPNNYKIEEIQIESTIYRESDIETIDSNHIRINYINDKSSVYNGYQLVIDKVKYTNTKNETITLDINQSYDFLILNSYKTFVINNVDDFLNIESGNKYILTANLDLKDINWRDLSFSGILDGEGHEIKNIHLYKGLFHRFSGTLKNIRFTNFRIEETFNVNSNNEYFSPIIKNTSGKVIISNCIINSDLNIDYKSTMKYNPYYSQKLYFGGFIANSDYPIEIIDSEYKGNINLETNGYVGNVRFGGFVGDSSKLITLKNVEMNGNIFVKTNDDLYLGGLVGHGNSFIDNSQVNANINVQSSGASIGGLVGGVGNLGSVYNSKFIGDIITTNTNNSIIASGIGNDIDKVINSHVEGNINIDTSTGARVAGVAYNSYYAYISDSTMTGDIKVKATNVTIGGVLVSSNADIYNSSMTGDIDAITTLSYSFNYVGGIIGVSYISWSSQDDDPIKFYLGNIDNCTMNGNIKVDSPERIFLGGIMSTGNANISNSRVEGNIDIKSNSYVFIGGILGDININPLLENNSFEGNINVVADKNAYVGGLVGYFAIDGDNPVKQMNVKYNRINSNLNVTTNLRTYTGGLFGYIDRSVTTDIFIDEAKYNGNINVKTPDNSFAAGIIAHSSQVISLNNIEVNGSITVDSGGSAYIAGVIASGTLNLNKAFVNVNLEATSSNTAYIGGMLAYNKYSASVNIDNSLYNGNLKLITNNELNYIEPFIGFDSYGTTILTNLCFISNKVIKIVNNEQQIFNQYSILNDSDLNNKVYFIDELAFDEDIWDLSNLNFENKSYPKLKKLN